MSMFRIDNVWRSFVEIQPRQGNRRIAVMLAQEAARRLSVPMPEIHFFLRQPYEKNFRGFTPSGDEIWIGSDLSGRETCETTIHEMKHVAQCRSVFWQTRTEQQRERDARLYELEWPR